MIETGDLSFRSEWQDAHGVRAAELRATWARLEIWAGDACVTRVEDESPSERRSIFVPLYPLAEWIAYNWWFLRAHGRPARVKPVHWTYSLLAEEDAAPYAWLRHHNFRGIGEGFLWPDLTCVPEGEYTRIVWRSGRVSGGSASRYTSSGEVLVESGLFVQALSELVESVITRLDEQGITATKLHEEWQALRDTTAEEAEFCDAAARLGLDPFDVGDELAGTLERAGSALTENLLRDFLDAVDPTRLDDTLDWVIGARDELSLLTEEPRSDLGDLRRVAAEAGGEPGPPWKIGIAQAKGVRSAIGIPFLEHLDLYSLISTGRREGPSRAIDGYGESSGGCRLLLSHEGRASDERFTEARALWHAVNRGSERFLITRAYTYQQKAERAFAAELLAPAAGIKALLRDLDGPWDFADVRSIAEHYEVNPLVIERQIENNIRL